ncbi:MAG: phosphate/phosphite/phosphonate ABC transporter substrate-binding protein, partial [Magnetococcales bacterium]|nr:phosphate/phosphite/phosphonate ABC transporter substrate-binding protein [Magnetococcales bacterium]
MATKFLRHKFFLRFAFVLLCLLLSTATVFVPVDRAVAGSHGGSHGTMTLAVHPFLSSREVIKRFRPLAQYIGGKLDRKVVVKVGKDYDEHIRFIGENRVDIAFLGPASFIMMLEKYGNKPLLARFEIKGKPFFQGKIIVRDQSPIHTLQDLENKRFAFGDPASTMSHIVPHYMLRQAGVKADRLQSHAFLGSHNNVAFAVLSGDYDAGAVKEAVFYKFAAKGLRALASTPKISEHLFVASGDLSPAVVKKLQTILSQLHKDKEGRAAMAAIKKSMTKMVPVKLADYDNLRVILKDMEGVGPSR